MFNSSRQHPPPSLRVAWNSRQHEQISGLLNQQLGPEYIAYRQGNGGMRVPYLEGWKVISLANEVFGFDGWNSEVISQTVDYVDESNGKISLGLSVVVRVTLKSGSFHEDVGYGHIENARHKAMAFEKCKKEATTDGMKRALRLFGNVLGNCLYDSTYLRNVARVEASKDNFNPDGLKRRPEFDPVKITSTTTPMAIAPVGGNSISSVQQTPTSHGRGALKVNTSAATNADPDPTNYEKLLNSQDFLSDDSDDVDWGEIDGLPAVKDEFPIPAPPVQAPEAQAANSQQPAGEGSELPATFFKIGDLKEVKPNTPFSLEAPFDPTSVSPVARRTGLVHHNKSAPVKRLLDCGDPTPPPLGSIGAPRHSQRLSQRRSEPPSELPASALNILKSPPEKRQKLKGENPNHSS